jgi:hypothetical protein
MASTGDLLARYTAGQHEEVWADMVALGPAVRDAAHLDDAWAVARETMRRARHNLELLIRRLDEMGYRFWTGREASPQAAPARTVTFNGRPITAPADDLLTALFDEAGRVPPAQITPAMIDQLTGAYRSLMFPWLDPALLYQRQSLPVDAQVRAAFEAAKTAPAGTLTSEMIEQLDRLRRSAMDEALAYWRGKGEDPPAIRDQREKEARQREAAQISDHTKDKRVLCPPSKRDLAQVRKIEKTSAVLPLALRAWIEEVGHVNLSGALPGLSALDGGDISGVFADPLMVSPQLFLFEVDDWLDGGASREPLDGLLGWDARTKARLAIEDGQLDHGYSLELPNPAADAVLKGAPHDLTLVGYLRLAFRCGGFPGWDGREGRPTAALARLAEGLLPI